MIKQYQLNKRQNNFDITLNYKGVKVKVNFSGGNTYKGIPPTLYEKDPFRQRAIEASQLFRDRDIVLKRTIAEAGDGKQTAVQARKVAVAPKTAVKKAVLKPAGQRLPIPQTPPEAPDTPAQDPPLDEGTGTQAMEFQNLGEAILYIAQHWQQQAKTEKEAREILKAHGINPKIKKN